MLTRTRVDLKDTIGVGRNQVEGLTAVASDVFGVNDWAMLEKIAQGLTKSIVLNLRSSAFIGGQTLVDIFQQPATVSIALHVHDLLQRPLDLDQFTAVLHHLVDIFVRRWNFIDQLRA